MKKITIKEEPGLRGLRKLGFLLYCEALLVVYCGIIPARLGWESKSLPIGMAGLLQYVQTGEADNG